MKQIEHYPYPYTPLLKQNAAPHELFEGLFIEVRTIERYEKYGMLLASETEDILVVKLGFTNIHKRSHGVGGLFTSVLLGDTICPLESVVDTRENLSAFEVITPASCCEKCLVVRVNRGPIPQHALRIRFYDLLHQHLAIVSLDSSASPQEYLGER